MSNENNQTRYTSGVWGISPTLFEVLGFYSTKRISEADLSRPSLWVSNPGLFLWLALTPRFYKLNMHTSNQQFESLHKSTSRHLQYDSLQSSNALKMEKLVYAVWGKLSTTVNATLNPKFDTAARLSWTSASIKSPASTWNSLRHNTLGHACRQ